MLPNIDYRISCLISNIVYYLGRINIYVLPVTVAERSTACTVFARKLEPWVRIPLRAWMFNVCVCVCVFLCFCTGREALRRADHPSKESYRLSLIKKLRELSPILQKREQAHKCGSNEEEKIYCTVMAVLVRDITDSAT
jgi:hypothetical protein